LYLFNYQFIVISLSRTASRSSSKKRFYKTAKIQKTDKMTRNYFSYVHKSLEIYDFTRQSGFNMVEFDHFLP